MEADRGIDSSLLVKPPAIICWLFFCILAVMFEKTAIGLFLGFVFVLTLSSCLWARAALKDIDFELSIDRIGLFPGQAFTVTRAIRNRKALPLIWAEIREACGLDECAAPGAGVIAEREISRDENSEPIVVCERVYTSGVIRRHRTVRLKDPWEARRRGILEIASSTVRSGDGFGLCAVGKRFDLPETKRIVVFPRLADVSVSGILNEMWDTGYAGGGYLKERSVIKSIRDYQPGDSTKDVNMRLLARGQSMKTNIYETVTPDTVLFVLDAASFREDPPEMFEHALSVLAALIDGLTRQGVATALMAPQSEWFAETCTVPSAADPQRFEMLELLAAASLRDAPFSAFPPFPLDEPGRVYLVCADVSRMTVVPAPGLLPECKTAVLVADGTGAASGLRVRRLCDFENRN
ncbi:MAG: DUF58 domain-containing protein [Clostridiales Family XIII bacterium]|jgi:uncharacterized protein (DUF58 family)|nr:DUF58 domain-containing protein [Clostridiales Family XIII bacterium]